MENQFVTLERAAKELCVHVATVRRWVREGQVPAVKMGRKYLIPAKVFAELIEAGIEEIPKKVPPSPPGADQELLPLWLQFDRRWYRRLYLIASKCSLNAAEILTRGMELVLKEHNRQKPERLSQRSGDKGSKPQ
jgi:excisionase family DNA binding protein